MGLSGCIHFPDAAAMLINSFMIIDRLYKSWVPVTAGTLALINYTDPFLLHDGDPPSLQFEMDSFGRLQCLDHLADIFVAGNIPVETFIFDAILIFYFYIVPAVQLAHDTVNWFVIKLEIAIFPRHHRIYIY